MGEVNCLYCGAAIGDDLANCPHCGAQSHFRRGDDPRAIRRRFLIWFWLLAAVCLLLMWWLPR
jgi:hypothetical protein